MVVVSALVLGAVAWFSPLLMVRNHTVRGASTVSDAEVLSALSVPLGTRLLPLDTAAAQARVESLRPLGRATVSRTWPDGLTVTVTERVAVAFVGTADGPHLIDTNGIDFATRAPADGVPELVVADPAADDDETRAAMTVLGALPAPLTAQVRTVRAPTPDAVTLELADERRVVWGSAENSADKAAVLAALLTQPGAVFDVSSPDLPTVS